MACVRVSQVSWVCFCLQDSWPGWTLEPVPCLTAAVTRVTLLACVGGVGSELSENDSLVFLSLEPGYFPLCWRTCWLNSTLDLVLTGTACQL